MHIDEACKLLGIDASTPEMWRQELLGLLHAQLEIKIKNAPTSLLQGKFTAAQAKLEQATELIKAAVENGEMPTLTQEEPAQRAEPKKQKFWDSLANPEQAIALIIRAAEGEDISTLTGDTGEALNQESLDPLPDTEDAIEIIELATDEGMDPPVTAEGEGEGEGDEDDKDEDEGEEDDNDDDDDDDNDDDDEKEEFVVIGDEEEEEEDVGELVFTIEKKKSFDSIRKLFGRISKMFASSKTSMVDASDKATEKLTNVIGGVIGGIVGSIFGNKFLRSSFLLIVLVGLAFTAFFGWSAHNEGNREQAIELTEYAEELEGVKAWSKAAEFYQQALDAKPRWQDAQDGLYRVKLALARELKSQLSMAELAEKNKNWSKALGHLKKAERIEPEDLEIQDSIDRVEKIIAELRGTLVIQTNPEGATINIGRHNRGRTSPATYENLGLGNYTISISKKGYEPIKQEIALVKGMNSLGPLALVRTMGSLNIITDPEGGDYVISQVSSEATSDLIFKPRTGQAPNLESDLPTGQYLIKTKRLGWMEEELNVRVTNVHQKEILIPFTKLDEKLDLTDLEIREKILQEAVDISLLKIRGEENDESVYGPKGGLYTGRVKQVHDNGQTRALFSVVEGKKQGLLFWWHDNGMKWADMDYRAGKKHGLFTFWDENGQKQSETHYVDGKKQGLCSMWGQNGKPQSETHYKEDQKDGLETLWRPNEQKESEINYAHDKKHGLAIEYYMDGKKRRTANYEEDVLHGTSASWDQYGQQRQEINYKHGLRHGLSTEWHANGQKSFESNWDDGDPHGLSISWDKNGKKRSETAYKNGQVVR